MPSLSLLLGVGAATLFSVASATKYTAQDTYEGSSFFDNFNFVTEDTNNGFVQYVDRSRAESQGYISYDDGDAIFGVDYKSTLSSWAGEDVGRESVSLQGKTSYNKGLFVLDIKHMPGGVCGSWPSFWAVGGGPWPANGEMDIIEGVNTNTANTLVLHTDTNCTVDGLGQTGKQDTYDCALDSSSGTTGCLVNDGSTATYGAGFNAIEGGYYVTEWQADAIKIWFFPRGSAPASLQTSSPDTSEFGTPNANFQGAGCDINKRFLNQRFMFSNTFCGDWGGNQYVYPESGCPMYSGLSAMDSCKKYVAENPAVFEDSYWRVSSFKTYNELGLVSSSSVAPSSTPYASSSSSAHVSSSLAHVSSSSVRVSSSMAYSSSAQSSSVVHSSATPTPHAPSSVYPSSNPAASSSYPHNVSSSVVYDSSSTYSPSASETPYSHELSSSVYSASASETPYPSDSPSIYPSASSPYPVSSHVSSIYPSETPYGSLAVYPSGTLSSVAYPNVTSYPVYKTSSSAPVYLNSTSAPVYSVYPEGDGYGYDVVSSKTAGASSKASAYPVVSTKVPDASSMTSDYFVVSAKYPDASSKSSGYGNQYPVASSKASESAKALEYNSYPAASSSVPVYGNGYPASSSALAYNHYPVSTPSVKSTPVYAVNSELPSSTPLYNTYPSVLSKPSYGDDKKSSDSYKTATAYETTYVDVCSTGYTTITTKITAMQTPAPYPTPNAYYAPPGFEVTTKYCAQGCGEGPKTVTVTVPCSKCQATTLVPNKPTSKASSMPSKPTNIPNGSIGNSPNTPAQTSQPPTPENSTTQVTATKIVTLDKIPVPESQYYATLPSIASASASSIKYPDSDSSKSLANSKPIAPTANMKPYPTSGAPASKPLAPTDSFRGEKPVYPGLNVTMSYGTATSAKGEPTQTGYKVSEFTGAASGLRVGGVLGAVAVFAAIMM